jgi:hypothetical protein
MASKPKARGPKSKEKEQSERFIETARELGVDETGKEFERALGSVLKKRKAKQSGGT